MADIASSDVVVTVERRTIAGKTRRNRVKIVFGNGTLTYPTNGVPMPAASAFGMKVRLDYLTVFDEDDSSGIFWKYDKDNKKLRAWWPTGGAQGPAAAPAAVAPIVMSGGATASAVDAVTPTIRAGHGRELTGTTSTIASHTLYAEAVGW